VDSLDLGTARVEALREVVDHDSYRNFLAESIATKSTSSKQSSYLQFLQALSRPMEVFTDNFANLVRPEMVDMSTIWGLLALNVRLALGSDKKLLRVTQWLGNLRRAIDSNNQASNRCQGNSVVIELTEVFESMLHLLINLIEFQETWVTGTQILPSFTFPFF
jgi:hypothetical protein